MAEEQTEQDVPILSRLRAPEGAVRRKKRKGRGIASHGKTSGKGMKGQKARHPGGLGMIGFEGGQMPLYRRLPKRGFHNLFSKNIATVNVQDLARFDAGATVDEAALREARLVRGDVDGIKILGKGELDKGLTVKVHAFSAGAKEKIEKAGGTCEVVAMTVPPADTDTDTDADGE